MQPRVARHLFLTGIEEPKPSHAGIELIGSAYGTQYWRYCALVRHFATTFIRGWEPSLRGVVGV